MAGSDDILSALLSGSMGGAGGGDDSGFDPGAMGMLKAYQGSDFLQGVPSRSGPLGQISQAIMPFLEAKIYEKQAQQDYQKQSVGHLVDIFKLATAIDERKLKQLELAAAQDPTGQLKPVVELVKSIRPGSGVKVSTKVGNTTVSMGDDTPTSELGMRLQLAGGDVGKALAAHEAAQREERAYQSNLVSDRMSRAAADREDAEKARQRAKRISTNQVYVDKFTGQKLPLKNQGEVEDYGDAALPLPPQQASTVGDIKNAWRELQVLKEASRKVLYKPTDNESPLMRFAGVKGTRAKNYLLSGGGDEDVRTFETTKKSAALALSRAITRSGRPPVAEYQAVDSLDMNKDTVQSATNTLKNWESYLLGVAESYGLDPGAITSTGQPETSEQATTLGRPESGGGGRVVDPGEISRTIERLRAMGKSKQEAKSILEGLYGKTSVDLK